MTAEKAIKRTKWVRDPLDYYQEDGWVSARLFQVEKFYAVLDPSCGSGAIVENAWAAGYQAIGSDITADGRRPNFLADFTASGYPMPEGSWDIISNPPFMHCLEKGQRNPETGLRRYPFVYIRLALHRARRKVALLLPSDYLLGEARQRYLAETPLARVYYLSPRPWCGPATIPVEERTQGFTDLIWLVFDKRHRGPWTGHFLNRDARSRITTRSSVRSSGRSSRGTKPSSR